MWTSNSFHNSVSINVPGMIGVASRLTLALDVRREPAIEFRKISIRV